MKKLITFIFIFSFYFANTVAQHKIRLDNHWEFLKTDLGSIWEGIRPYNKGASESVPVWSNVTLPHCYNAEDAVDPHINYYQGPAWYRTYLSIENPYENGRTLLHFEGAGQKTKVFVYDQEVGNHIGGYDEWSVDITDAIRQFKQKNVYQNQFKNKVPILIRVDNSRDVELIPSDLSDFNVYGGIYRYLNLVYLPKYTFDALQIIPRVDEKGKSGELAIEVIFGENLLPRSLPLAIKVTDPAGKVIFSRQSQITTNEKNIKILTRDIKNPALWSPDSPNLYTAEVILGSGENRFQKREKFGFRHFEFVENGPFRLNGQRLLLRGTHRHEDHAGVGAAMTEEMMKQEMKMMKDMGVNFIRLGHYQQSRIILDACDSLGILVWEEIPWCRGGLGGPVYQQQAKNMLTNMIYQHYNHPAVILWGMGNENDWPNDFPEFDKEKIRSFMKELHNLSHQLDDSRLTAIRRCDFCKDIVDVYSPSIWAGWYRGLYTDYKTASESEFKKVKRFLHVEWGGDSHARRHSESPDNMLSTIQSSKSVDERGSDASLYGGAARASKDGDWSESYICNLIDWHLKEQETMPWLTGTAYWPFKDFSTPVRPENPVPYVNQKGVVERDFTKKESYYIFQSYWTDRPMAHIYGHSWPVRWGKAGEEKMIKVYSNCDQAELFLNGKSLGTKKRNSQDFPAAGLRWLTPLKAGKNHIKVVAKKGKETVTDEITTVYQEGTWSAPQKLTLQVVEAANGMATIEALLWDAQGKRCLDARNIIRFSQVGTGKLLVNLGTSSGASQLEMYNGRALVKLQRGKGKDVICAQVKGLEDVFLTVE